jgi:DnaJ-class molecular chaperone
VYGQPHNTSLPTVLEHGNQRGNPDRNRKRASWAPDDDFDAGGDFTLFDSSDPAAAQNLFNTPQSSNPTSQSSSKQDIPPGNIIQDLPVSLTDLFAGTKKRVPVHRLLPDSMSGQLQRFAEVLDVQVYAGLRPGSRITMAKLGDYVPRLQTFGDLVFILVEKPHDTFNRDGRDLIMRTEVTMYESLCGWSRNVTTVCGQTLQVSLKRPTPAGEMVPVGAYGMPKFVGKDAPPGPRGDLILKVDVRWPTTGFDSRQRALLRQALGEGGKSPRF